MIDDTECEVSLPSPVDDRYLPASGSTDRASESQFAIPLLPTIGVIRGISQLLKSLNTPILTPLVLQSFDSLFGECVAAFPSHQNIRSDGYLEPYSLPPLLYLQNARLMLHRHNLTTLSPPEARSAAVHHCVIVAQDTARLLSRCMRDSPEASQQPPIQYDQWENRLASVASAFLCTHIWRCTLFLCFRGIYDAALLCARASAILGDARPVNTSCGQYLEFFLMRLTSKLQHGEEVHLEGDEDMIAYVSADLQGSIENSWVWQGAEGDVRLSERLKNPSPADSGKADYNARAETARGGDGEWTGWGRILDMLEQLIRKRQQREQQHLVAEEAPMQAQRDPAQATSPRNPSLLQDNPAASNRIRISDIM